MEIERYPKNLSISIEDFRRTQWKGIVQRTENEKGTSLWHSFSTAARQAIQDGNLTEGKVLWLLSDASSLSLDPESANEPFKPFMVLADGHRSVIPSDFESADVEFFYQIVDDVIDTPWLQARLAELIWLLKPREFRFAIKAVEAYQKLPLTLDSWLGDGGKMWARALRLSMSLGQGAREKFLEIERVLLGALLASDQEDGFLGMWISDLLLRNRLSLPRQDEIAKKLETLGRLSDASGDHNRGREYFLAAEKWHSRGKNKPESCRMILFAADSLVKDAESRISGPSRSFMAAAGFLEKAIQTLRRIPRSERGALGVDAKIAQLHDRLTDAGERALLEMGQVTTHEFDISKMVESAKESVRNKPIKDALYEFAYVFPGFQETKIRASAEKHLRQSIVRSLFGSTHYSRDGRVIAKSPAMNLMDAASGENEKILRDEMISNYARQIQIAVQAYIFPALEVMQLEHVWHEYELVRLTNLAPIIPPGRERLYGKALFKGFDGDFISALHLLVPQIEHMVRWHLKQNSVKTTTLDGEGIETENGLSTLMDQPKLKAIFGEDVVFEIKALFCDAGGPNLRNELAHGLLGFEASQSVFSIYAWWFGLKMAVITYWNAALETEGGSHTSSLEATEHGERNDSPEMP